jgi:uncharacterized FlaG/YvyC family protein
MIADFNIKTSADSLSKASTFAKSNGYSLERLMEGYIRFLAQKKDEIELESGEMNDLLKELHSEFEFSLDANAKREYRRYLIEKYK